MVTVIIPLALLEMSCFKARHTRSWNWTPESFRVVPRTRAKSEVKALWRSTGSVQNPGSNDHTYTKDHTHPQSIHMYR